jgi:hypothetical protein
VCYLLGNRLNYTRQVVVFPLAVLHPRCEVAQFAVISVIREPHLGADEDNSFVMYDHPAVVNYVLVYNGPNKIAVTDKTRKIYRMLTFPNRKEFPWFHPMTKSLPKLPMNEGPCHLYDNEQVIIPAVRSQTFQKVVVTTIATDESKSLLEYWIEDGD